MDRLVLINENVIIAMWSHVLSLGSCVLLFHILAIYVCQEITLLITKYTALCFLTFVAVINPYSYFFTFLVCLLVIV